jgi:hypothetical protein
VGGPAQVLPFGATGYPVRNSQDIRVNPAPLAANLGRARRAGSEEFRELRHLRLVPVRRLNFRVTMARTWSLARACSSSSGSQLTGTWYSRASLVSSIASIRRLSSSISLTADLGIPVHSGHVLLWHAEVLPMLLQPQAQLACGRTVTVCRPLNVIYHPRLPLASFKP